MAENETSPVRGEVIVEEEQSFVSRAVEYVNSHLLKLAIALLAVGIVGIIGYAAFQLMPRQASEKHEAELPPPVIQTSTTPDPNPLNPKGVQSWSEWLETATPAQWEALEELCGIRREQVEKWAAEEELFGKSFETSLPVGTPLTNSGAKNGSWYPVKNYTVKPGDTIFLSTDKGTVVVKVSCGNPVKLAPPSKTRRKIPPPPPPPTKRADNPLGPPQRPGNPTYGNPPANPTPGYTPGNAETVVGNQQSQPVGGTDPTPYGTPGGSGGTTPSGSNSAGEEAPQPTTPPDTGLAGETASGSSPDVN